MQATQIYADKKQISVNPRLKISPEYSGSAFHKNQYADYAYEGNADQRRLEIQII